MEPKNWRSTCFLVFLLQALIVSELLTTLALAKRGGGGGMGRSGSRTGSMGRNSGGSAPRMSQPVYNRPSGGTGIGAGAKKPGGGWAKPALAGAAGVVIGAAVAHQLTKSHYKYGYGGRDYYYGDRYYRQSHSYATKCIYPLPAENQPKYDDGTTVRELVFECDGRREHCCEMGCCPGQQNTYGRQPAHVRKQLSWWVILLLIVAMIGVLSCCMFAVMRYRRRQQNFAFAGGRAGEASVPLQAPGGNTYYPAGDKAYAPQPTPYYPNAPTYPAGGWQGQPTSYPQQPGPPPYGFNAQPTGPYPGQY